MEKGLSEVGLMLFMPVAFAHNRSVIKLQVALADGLTGAIGSSCDKSGVRRLLWHD